MKCQAIDPTFSPVLIHIPFDPPTFQSMWRSFQNLKDVGVVQVKVIRAEGLMAADVTGKTAPPKPEERGHHLQINCSFFYFPLNVIKDV